MPAAPQRLRERGVTNLEEVLLFANRELIPLLRGWQNSGVVDRTGALKIEWFAPSVNDVSASFNRAIQSLPATTGGVIDASGLLGDWTIADTIVVDRPLTILGGCTRYPATTTTPFYLNGAKRFALKGASRQTEFVSASGGTIFTFGGSWSTNQGDPQFEIDAATFTGGGGGATMLVMPAATVTEALNKVSRCFIHDFDGVALTTGDSTPYWRIEDNYFAGNYQSIFAGNASDIRIESNIFLGRFGGSDQLRIRGGSVATVGNNWFLHSAWSDLAVYSDILIDVSVSTIYGTRIRITENKFGPENESLNPLRSRIRCENTTTGDLTLISSDVEIDRNWFDGAGPFGATFTRSGNVVTCSLLEVGNTTPRPHAMQPGATVIVHVLQSSDVTFNLSTVTATASGTATLTWAQVAADATATGFVVAAQETAIWLKNPVHIWGIHHNDFYLGGQAVNDDFNAERTDTNVDSYKRDHGGHSIFADNRFFGTYDVACMPFKNGGKGFSVVRAPQRSGDATNFGTQISRHEPVEQRNRIQYSESIGTLPWVIPAGYTVDNFGTHGVADPYGGTKAFKITRATTWDPAAVGNVGLGIRQGIDLTGIGTRVHFGIWMLQGSVSIGMMALLNNPNSTYSAQRTCELTAKWQFFPLTANGINTAEGHEIDLYPSSMADDIPGSIYVAFPLVCDFEDGDYVPTAGAVVADTTRGRRFQLATTFAGGLLAGDTGTVVTWHASATATWDPANIAPAGQATKTVAITGALLGDIASASFSLDLQGMTMTAYVSSADTVTVVLYNGTAGAVDLASGTLRAAVTRH